MTYSVALRRCGFLFVIALLVAPKVALADIETIRNSDRAIWGSVGTGFLNYKEQIGSPYLPDSDRGWLAPSLAGGVSWLGGEKAGTARNIYLSFDTTGTWGSDTYRGAYLATPTAPLQSNTYDHVWTVDGKVGRAFPIGSKFMVTPYADLGYRYWSRNLGSFIEDYDHYAFLGGVMGQFSPTSRLIFTGYGAAGATFAASMKTLGDNYDLGSSGTYRLGGKVGFDMTERVELFTALDFNHFAYNQSALASDGTYEPSSTTSETTWRVGVSYHFN